MLDFGSEVREVELTLGDLGEISTEDVITNFRSNSNLSKPLRVKRNL